VIDVHFADARGGSEGLLLEAGVAKADRNEGTIHRVSRAVLCLVDAPFNHLQLLGIELFGERIVTASQRSENGPASRARPVVTGGAPFFKAGSRNGCFGGEHGKRGAQRRIVRVCGPGLECAV
jgi:hypothetical protein